MKLFLTMTILSSERSESFDKEDVAMQAYGITYTVKGENKRRDILIDAKDVKSAKRKIGKKHGYKDGRMIKLERVSVIVYF